MKTQRWPRSSHDVSCYYGQHVFGKRLEKTAIEGWTSFKFDVATSFPKFSCRLSKVASHMTPFGPGIKKKAKLYKVCPWHPPPLPPRGENDASRIKTLLQQNLQWDLAHFAFKEELSNLFHIC